MRVDDVAGDIWQALPVAGAESIAASASASVGGGVSRAAAAAAAAAPDPPPSTAFNIQIKFKPFVL